MNKQDLDTPFVIIDLDKVDRNIANMQKVASDAGIALRPHAKTHKMPQIALMQVQAGALGVTVAKLGEAEVMMKAGIKDILIAYPIIGKQKLERLIQLSRQTKVTIAVDSYESACGIARAASDANTQMDILIEMDCGFGRVGLPPGIPILDLAKQISELSGITFKGILTFAGHSYDAPDEEGIREVGLEEGRLATETANLLRKHDLPVAIISAGSTPTAKFVSQVPGVTEIRPGTYVFGDLMQVSMGAHELVNCALTVKVTVISRPAHNRAVVDAGTKIFTMDGGNSPLGTGRGLVVGHPGIQVAWFTEEHGMLELSTEEEILAIGDTLEIIPVHCCGVVNMVDEIAAVRGTHVEAIWPVLGRGKSR